MCLSPVCNYRFFKATNKCHSYHLDKNNKVLRMLFWRITFWCNRKITWAQYVFNSYGLYNAPYYFMLQGYYDCDTACEYVYAHWFVSKFDLSFCYYPHIVLITKEKTYLNLFSNVGAQRFCLRILQYKLNNIARLDININAFLYFSTFLFNIMHLIKYNANEW